MAAYESPLLDEQGSIARGCKAVSYTPNFAHCDRHGPLTSNLCERCLESLSGYCPIYSPHELIINAIQFSLLYVLSRTEGLLNKLIAMRVMEGLGRLLGFLITAIICIAKFAATVFACLFLSLFLGTPLSPQDRRRQEIEADRKKAEDEAWRARRDADYARQRSEQEAWERAREADDLRKRKEKEQWEEQRERDYRKARAEQEKWERDRDERFQKARREDEERRRKEREEDEAEFERLMREAEELRERMRLPSVNPSEELERLHDIETEVEHSNLSDSAQQEIFDAVEDAEDAAKDEADDDDDDDDDDDPEELEPEVH